MLRDGDGKAFVGRSIFFYIEIILAHDRHHRHDIVALPPVRGFVGGSR